MVFKGGSGTAVTSDVDAGSMITCLSAGYDKIGKICAISGYSSSDSCGVCDMGIWVEFGINQELTEAATAEECNESQGEQLFQMSS